MLQGLPGWTFFWLFCGHVDRWCPISQWPLQKHWSGGSQFTCPADGRDIAALCLAQRSLLSCCLGGSCWGGFRSDACSQAWSQPLDFEGYQTKTLGWKASATYFSCASQRGLGLLQAKIFQFTGWKESIGCCFRCNITNDRLHECGAKAIWKQPENRLTHVDNMARVSQKGLPINRFWGIPFYFYPWTRLHWLAARCRFGSFPIILGKPLHISAGDHWWRQT